MYSVRSTLYEYILELTFYLNQYACNGKYVVGLYVSNIENAAG